LQIVQVLDLRFQSEIVKILWLKFFEIKGRHLHIKLLM